MCQCGSFSKSWLTFLQVENPIPLQSVIKLPDYLITMSDKSTKLPTVCWNKALDILSQSLPYGDMVSPTTNVFSPQVKKHVYHWSSQTT